MIVTLLIKQRYGVG